MINRCSQCETEIRWSITASGSWTRAVSSSRGAPLSVPCRSWWNTTARTLTVSACHSTSPAYRFVIASYHLHRHRILNYNLHQHRMFRYPVMSFPFRPLLFLGNSRMHIVNSNLIQFPFPIHSQQLLLRSLIKIVKRYSTKWWSDILSEYIMPRT